MKILKKYTEGGTPKAKSKGLTDREVWESNKDGVQQKYSSFEDYQKATKEKKKILKEQYKKDKKDLRQRRKEEKYGVKSGVPITFKRKRDFFKKKIKSIFPKKKGGESSDNGAIAPPESRGDTPSGFAGMIAKAAMASKGGKMATGGVSPKKESNRVSPKKESKRSWVGNLVDRTKKKYNRFVQKRKEKPMSEKEFYEPNIAKGGGSGYKSMTEHGNLGRGISALMTKKTQNPDSWTAEDEAKLKRMQRIQEANKPDSKESVRDIYLEDVKKRQDKSQAEWDTQTAKWEKEDIPLPRRSSALFWSSALSSSSYP